jgi:hypothetical protein
MTTIRMQLHLMPKLPPVAPETMARLQKSALSQEQFWSYKYYNIKFHAPTYTPM